MAAEIDAVYSPSEDIVARVIGGELIIVPLVAGIGDMDDELFALNDTGKAIWDQLDGATSLCSIAKQLAERYDASLPDIERDIKGLADELLRRRILVEVTSS